MGGYSTGKVRVPNNPAEAVRIFQVDILPSDLPFEDKELYREKMESMFTPRQIEDAYRQLRLWKFIL